MCSSINGKLFAINQSAHFLVIIMPQFTQICSFTLSIFREVVQKSVKKIKANFSGVFQKTQWFLTTV
jgi:hypothetical protein